MVAHRSISVAATLFTLGLAACGGPEFAPRAPGEDAPIDTAEEALTPLPIVIPNVLFTAQLADINTCVYQSDTAPDAGESHQYEAVRLVPPNGTGTITRIDYLLSNRAARPDAPWSCSTNFAHTVKVWKQVANTPAATPVGGQSVVMAARPSAEPVVRYSWTLPTRIKLNAGESLFVAVESGGTVPNTTCFTTCKDADPAPGTVFWSFATTAPFAWADLAGWGLGRPFFSATGY